MKKTETKATDVASFLTKTGFIFEMEMAELLKKQGYQVKVNYFFFDLEGGKRREVDIIAKKEINSILVNLVIECKQSEFDDWIFICSDKKPSRYYNSVKHYPKVTDLKKTKLFDHLHFFNREIPLAQNYIVFQKNKGAKGNDEQMKECLMKLPKALIYIASKVNEDKKNIFFPIALFSKQFFSANYEKQLKVREEKLVQFCIDFDSDFYKKSKKNPIIPKESRFDMLSELDPFIFDNLEVAAVIEAAENLNGFFQIDFVTKKYFLEYLQIIEDEVSKIAERKWTFNVKKYKSVPF